MRFQRFFDEPCEGQANDSWVSVFGHSFLGLGHSFLAWFGVVLGEKVQKRCSLGDIEVQVLKHCPFWWVHWGAWVP